jgi:hypothetical protein
MPKRHTGPPVDAKGSCGYCIHWKPKMGSAQFGVCQGGRGDFHGQTIPLSWGCSQWEDEENTPVEIPESLHRKRTEGSDDDSEE